MYEKPRRRSRDIGAGAQVQFIDTADVYGGPQRPDIPLGYGISEEILTAPDD